MDHDDVNIFLKIHSQHQKDYNQAGLISSTRTIQPKQIKESDNPHQYDRGQYHMASFCTCRKTFYKVINIDDEPSEQTDIEVYTHWQNKRPALRSSEQHQTEARRPEHSPRHEA